jgi:kynurenine formamidase
MRELSHRITGGMQVYPGDPAVTIEPALLLAQDGVDVTMLHLGSHTGTHLDAPSHTVAGGRTTGSIGLEELVGEALVVHLAPLAPGSTYGVDQFASALGTMPDFVPRIVIVHTGWARHFGTAVALAHPSLDPAAAERLLRRGMRLLAVDTLSPDPTGADAGFPVHEVVLGADALIVENLAGLEALPERVRVGFFPLPIDADGAPVRAVAFDG